jgi:hypothetical protein
MGAIFGYINYIPDEISEVYDNSLNSALSINNIIFAKPNKIHLL